MYQHKQTPAKKAITPQKTASSLDSGTSQQARILQLQKKLGNRVVSQLLARQKSSSQTGSVMQAKRMKVFMPGDYTPLLESKGLLDSSEKQNDIKTLQNNATSITQDVLNRSEDARNQTENWYKDLTQKGRAAKEVKDEMLISGVSDGHAQHFIDLVQNQALKSGNGALLTAAAGYLIEDIATKSLPHNWLQVTPPDLNGSRPDIYMPHKATSLNNRLMHALIDITSEQSEGHVLEKGNGAWVERENYPFVAEALYTPLSFSGGTGMDPEARKKLLEALKLRHKDKLARFETEKNDFSRRVNDILSELDATPLTDITSRVKKSLASIYITPEHDEPSDLGKRNRFTNWKKHQQLDNLIGSFGELDRQETLVANLRNTLSAVETFIESKKPRYAEYSDDEEFDDDEFEEDEFIDGNLSDGEEDDETLIGTRTNKKRKM